MAGSIQVKPVQPAGKAAKSVAKAAPKSAAKSASSSKSGSKAVKTAKPAAKAPKAVAKAAKPATRADKSTAKSAKKAPAAKAPAKAKVAAAKPKAPAKAPAAARTAKASVKTKAATKGAKTPVKAAKSEAKAPKAKVTVAKAASKAAPVKAARSAPAKASKAETKASKPEAKTLVKASKSEAKTPVKAAKSEGKAASETKAPKAEGKPASEAKAAKVKRPALTGTAAVAAAVERSKLRASQTLPPVGTLLTRREMEQLLTAGQGRGVSGEGSLKGRLIVKNELPTLVVTGRDKRELHFVLQGPEQAQFPQFVDYRVSVSGLIRKTSNYAGTVDVRRYTAKRADLEEVATPEEPKLRYLSPGEVTQLIAPSMGAGMKGFASVRGQLEMSGDRYVVVLSNGGTRHQVTFVLTGKNAKSLRKLLGRTVQVMGVMDKTTGWGGTIEVESVEPRAGDVRKIDRKHLTVHSLRHGEGPFEATVRVGEALSVRLDEEAEHTWAIEPMIAKRVALREVAFEPVSGSAGLREFFFTPRTPGTFEVEYFQGKLLSPAHVTRSIRMALTVRA